MQNRTHVDDVKFLLEGKPVIVLTGKEFEKKEDVSLIDQVAEYFDKIGNKANSIYGDVILNRKCIRADTAHGISREKTIAFKAVSDVIEKGIVILPLSHKNNNKFLSAMFAAPIAIAEKEYIAIVVIRQNHSSINKLYVHEVSLKNKLLESEIKNLLNCSSNPILKTSAVNQGEIAKVLRNFLFSKN